MAKKKRVYERLIDQSEAFERVDVREVEEALGAHAEPAADMGQGGSPFSLLTLRSRLLTELVSTGGRPGRKEAIVRKKIPLTETEWKILDQITDLLKGRGVNATSGQVAGILLHQSMTEVLERLEKVTPSRDVNANSTKDLSEKQLEETVETIFAAAASAEAHLGQLRPVAMELLRRMRLGKGSESDDK